jgi:hypothetical protein
MDIKVKVKDKEGEPVKDIKRLLLYYLKWNLMVYLKFQAYSENERWSDRYIGGFSLCSCRFFPAFQDEGRGGGMCIRLFYIYHFH